MKTKTKIYISPHQILNLIILFAILLLLPLILLLLQKRQDIRNRAAGTYEVGIKLVPASKDVLTQESFAADLTMYKIADREITSSGAQSVLAVSNKLTISSAECISPFNGLPFIRINETDNTVTIMCAIAIGTNPVNLTQDIVFAKVNFIAKENVLGSAPVNFQTTRITESGVQGQAPDVSTAGENAEYNIVNEFNDSPTATPTIMPSITDAQGGPQCSQNNITAGDCYDFWKMTYSNNQYLSNVDFNDDNKVDLIDYEIWRRANYS